MRPFPRALLIAAGVAGLVVVAWLLVLRPTPEQPASTHGFDPAAFLRSRPKLDAPYVVSDFAVVDAMLALAQVGPGDQVVDLGSGDGRILIAAARSHGARGLGVEIDPERIREAEANARAARVTGQVAFRQQDLFRTDLREADVVTLYLSEEVNLRLKPRILAQMRSGTRVVSHEFGMGNWRPDIRQRVGRANVFLWVVPARIAGRWRLEADGGRAVITLEQDANTIRGAARGDAGTRRIEQGRLAGTAIRFITDIGEGRRAFVGRVEGDRLVASGAGSTWRAERLN